MCALRVPAVHFGAAAPERQPDRTGTTPGRYRQDRSPAALRQSTVWVLASHRAGDASQVLALAEAIGWPFEIKRLTFKPLEHPSWHRRLRPAMPGSTVAAPVPSPRHGPTSCSPPVERTSPWRAGSRRRSGGRTRIVQVGRPWGPLAAYDLVVTTPQYRLPAAQRARERCALHRVTPERLRRRGRTVEDRLARLPRPLIAVLVGGNSGPYA